MKIFSLLLTAVSGGKDEKDVGAKLKEITGGVLVRVLGKKASTVP